MKPENIYNLIESFKIFNESIIKSKISNDKTAFYGLLSGFNSINSISKSYEKKLASNYNIFYILRNIYKDEERTHSPFLADLLNIDGEHKQGELFFNEFLKLLKNKFNLDYSKNFNDIVYVETEKYTGDGSIDILISCNTNNNPFAIAIENKIYAQDQPKQLERYSNYLKRVYNSNYLLIYLSPLGHRPSVPFSISEPDYLNLISNGKLIIMSYKEHILAILDNVNSLIEAPNVRTMINQYSEIIKNL